MTPLLTSRRMRWAVPAVVAAAVAAAAITTTNTAGASDQPKLPARTAAQLLAAVEQVHPQSLSGTIVETAKLGLPDLPASDVRSGMSLLTLATGSHTMRIWYDGPSRQRIALLAPMAERDVIHNGTDLWTFTSTTNEVTHSTVGRSDPTSGPTGPDTRNVTPQQAAQQALRAIDPTTKVTVDRTARVAGRAAYQLNLTPRDSRSLIGSVRIAIDAATSVPLQVQVFAAGATSPAIQVGFTDISFGSPSPSVFDFVPPAGAKVTQQPLTGPPARGGNSSGQGEHGTGPSVLGTSWTTVVKIPASGQTRGATGGMLEQLSKPVPGGRLITTALVSILITSDGTVFAGPVSGAALQQVASTGHGL